MSAQSCIFKYQLLGHPFGLCISCHDARLQVVDGDFNSAVNFIADAKEYGEG